MDIFGNIRGSETVKLHFVANKTVARMFEQRAGKKYTQQTAYRGRIWLQRGQWNFGAWWLILESDF